MDELVNRIFQQTDWSALPQLAEWVVEQALTIQQIPAPTFDEAERAAYVARQFADLHLQQIDTDPQHNVYGKLPGHDPDKGAIMVVAHTDTVFSKETNLANRYNEDWIYGPGLGDNSIGVSGMLAVARSFVEWKLNPECDVWFVATSCEEGLGDLRGMKAAFERLQSQIRAVINVEGLAFGHVYHAGIAVHRLRISAYTEGGHSWLHFGRPSAIHAIVQLGERLTRLNVPRQPRTTFNIGLLGGGQSINTIAAEANLWLDIRSENRGELEKVIEQVYAQIKALESPEVRFVVEVVGDRPAGRLEPHHPLVKGALAAISCEGTSGALEIGSTDGNVPLAAGCPAVTVGITRGGNAHRLDEYIEVSPVKSGLRQLIMLTLAAAESTI